MIAARVLDPRSKLATARGLASETQTGMPGEELGAEDATAEDLCEAMDRLLLRQPRIERTLAARHVEDGSLVLCDLTSVYFEGTKCPPAKRGCSRDGRRGKLRIVFALLCDREGRPVAARVFEGSERDEQRIAEESALDGICMIRTNVPAGEMGPEDTVRACKSLSRAERAFRSFKGVDLKVRPVHHRLADRVRAHVFLRMLACCVEWHMRRAPAPLLFDDHDPAAAEAARASPVAPACVSRAAHAKKAGKRTPEGLPVHSFRTLLRDLATLTRNRVRPPRARSHDRRHPRPPHPAPGRSLPPARRPPISRTRQRTPRKSLMLQRRNHLADRHCRTSA